MNLIDPDRLPRTFSFYQRYN